MAKYTYREVIEFFNEKVKTEPPKEDLSKGEVELVIDNQHVLISQGKHEGSMNVRIILGLILHPLREERLKELATSNFLGINTGGCKFSFDETGVSLWLEATQTCGTTPQEYWEWLHRSLSVAREWNQVLTLWEEFVPLGQQHGKN